MSALSKNNGILIASWGSPPCLSNLGYVKLLKSVIAIAICSRQCGRCWIPPHAACPPHSFGPTGAPGCPVSWECSPFPSPVSSSRSPEPSKKVPEPHLRKLPLCFPCQRCLWVPRAVTPTSAWDSSSGSSAQKPRAPGFWLGAEASGERGKPQKKMTGSLLQLLFQISDSKAALSCTKLGHFTFWPNRGKQEHDCYKDSMPRSEAELSNSPAVQSRSPSGTHFLG